MVTVGDLWTMDLTQACSEVALKQQQKYTNFLTTYKHSLIIDIWELPEHSRLF